MAKKDMRKVSAVSLSGLSPETVLAHPQAQPLETPGLAKAREILTRAGNIKLASKLSKEEKANAYDKIRDTIVPAGTGAGGGLMLAGLMAKEAPTRAAKILAASGGAAVGLADRAITKHKEQNMHKKAGFGEEELARLTHHVMTRTETRDQVDQVFAEGKAARAADRATIKNLFLQAPGASTNGINLAPEKTAGARTTEFFESGGHLTEAQRRFPELLKVAKKGK